MGLLILNKDFYEQALKACILHRDESKAIVLMDTKTISERLHNMLQTDGLTIQEIAEGEPIKTTTQTITCSMSNPALSDSQWLIEFEI